jgi:hypothetical protein
MKKLLFMAVLGIGGTMFVKQEVSISPDSQVRVAGWTVPLPPSVQNSPVMGMVTMMARLQTTPPASPPDPRSGAAQHTRPAVPNVTSVAGTYNANAPSAGQSPGGDQFGAVAKALRGQ